MPQTRIDINGSRATLTLDRPDARNALSLELLRDFSAALDSLASCRDVHVVTLTGAGQAFCAGMDLKQVLDDVEAARVLLESLGDCCLKLRSLPAVTIASVHGAAIGGGCGLTAVCDFCITHADSKMGFPEVDLGVCPAVVAPWVVRRIGAGRARALLLRGGIMSGQDAFEIGLVTQVVPTRADLETATVALAERLSTGGADALRATRRLLNELDGSMDAELSRRCAGISATVLGMAEARARLREKMSARKP